MKKHFWMNKFLLWSWCREKIVSKILINVRLASHLRSQDQFDQIVISTIAYYLFLDEFPRALHCTIQQKHFLHFFVLTRDTYYSDLDSLHKTIQKSDQWLYDWLQTNFVPEKNIPFGLRLIQRSNFYVGDVLVDTWPKS